MAKWSVLTARTLKPGSYDDWRAAWEPAEWPEGVSAYILRKAGNPDEVIAFGFFDGTRKSSRRCVRMPTSRKHEALPWLPSSRTSSRTASTRSSR